MWPVLAQIEVAGITRPIGSYGVMLALAILFASSLFVWRTQRDESVNFDVGHVIAATAVAIGAGFVGANLLFMSVELLRSGVLVWREGRFGIVFIGGAIGGAIGLFVAAHTWSLPIRSLFDHAAVALALGHAIGRVGCLLGGCCFGVPWHGLDGHGLLAVTDSDAVTRAPLPIIEACAVSSLITLLLWLRDRSRVSWLRAPGRLALGYALGYATLRIALEPWRDDQVRGVMLNGMLSTSQLLCLLFLMVTLAWWRGATLRSVRRVGHGGLLLALMTGGAALCLPWHAEPARAQLTMQAPSVITIDAGWFVRGSSDEDIEFAVEMCRQSIDRTEVCNPELFDDERPAQRVYLSAYRIDRTEVDNASYRRCIAANICAPQRASDADPRLSEPRHPVSGITFGEAQRYCQWLGGSLPTEAQWEKAARGQNGRRFPWGNLWNSRLANHGRAIGTGEDPVDGYNYAAAVDAFVDARSPYGMLNAAGNVAELTSDYYSPDAYRHDQRIDPRGPSQGTERVVRGGSWRSPGFALRTTHRTHMADNDAQPDVGFRCSYPR